MPSSQRSLFGRALLWRWGLLVQIGPALISLGLDACVLYYCHVCEKGGQREKSLVPGEGPLLLRMLDDLLLDWKSLPSPDVVHVCERSVLGIGFFPEVQVLFLCTRDPERIDVQRLEKRAGRQKSEAQLRGSVQETVKWRMSR